MDKNSFIFSADGDKFYVEHDGNRVAFNNCEEALKYYDNMLQEREKRERNDCQQM